MPLIALWESSSAVVEQFSIEQVVAMAGNGELRDGIVRIEREGSEG
jgi:hypothetical protein